MNQTTTINTEPRVNRNNIRETQLRSILFLNRRCEGICDACGNLTLSSEFSRHTSSGEYGEKKFTVVSYICVDCEGLSNGISENFCF